MTSRRPEPASTRRGLLLHLVVVLLVCLIQILPPAAAAPTATSSDEPREPTVTLDAALEPAQLDQQTEVRVRVRVTAGDSGLSDRTTVGLGVLPDLLSSRYAVARWADAGGTGSQGARVAEGRLGSDLAPGQSTVVDLVVPAGALPLADTDPWGPRAASIVLSDDESTLAVTRTHLVWGHPDEQAQRTLVTIVVPVVADASDPHTGAMSRASLARATQPGSRLDAALAAAEQPGVTVALDPALLNVSSGDEEAAGVPDPAVQQWIDRISQVATTHDTLVLGYADPDVAALVHADQTDLLRRGQQLGIEVAQAGVADQTGLRADVGFPADGTLDTATLEAYQEMGRGTAVIVSESAMPTRRRQSLTVTGRSDLPTDVGEVPMLIADKSLSESLARVGATDGKGDGALAVQRLQADGAALSREAPGRARHVLVVAPRTWEPTPANARAAVQAVTATPWTSAVTLQSLIDAEPGPARVSPRVTAAQQETELPAFGLRDVTSTLEQTESLVTVLADPTGASRTASAQAVSLTSWQWRANLDGWRNARRTFARTPQDLRSAVHVLPGSPVTQVSRNVRLPVAVQNDAPQAVRVVLDVTPRSSRLVVPGPVTVDVPPGARAVGYVPVRGVGNGDTAVSVQLRLANGVPLGEPTEIRVQVRADWETKGAWVFAGTAAVILLIGLIRSVRRGTREARLRDDDPDALDGTRDDGPTDDDTDMFGAPLPASASDPWQVPRETSSEDATEGGR